MNLFSLRHSVTKIGRVLSLFTLIGTLAVQSGSVMAATSTASILVTATVVNACLIAATPLAFLTYDPTSATATTANSTITATCTLSSSYTIGLNNGTGTGADATAGAQGRKMTIAAGTATLGYNLYQDAGFTTLWGTGANVLSATGSGILQTYTVRGRIPALQSAGAGAYSDTVTATITF